MFKWITCYTGLHFLVTALAFSVMLNVLSVTANEAVKAGPDVQSYNKATGVSGKITSIGSDTMNNLMTRWCQGFNKHYPEVRCQIEGRGSSTALPALIEGKAQFGPMSRPMDGAEMDQFGKTFGYKPTAVETAIDDIAIYVNKDNPIDCLTIEQVDAIFSKANNCGAADGIKTWGQAGLTGHWANRSISLYGRNTASGTYRFFKEHALCEGDFQDGVKEQPTSALVVQGVTEDIYGIGYSGIGYMTSGAKAIKLGKAVGECAEPNLENALAGTYPLGRYLYLYVNMAPNKEVDRLTTEFLKFVLSDEGQEIVIENGYLPIPPKVGEENLRKVVSQGDTANITPND